MNLNNFQLNKENVKQLYSSFNISKLYPHKGHQYTIQDVLEYFQHNSNEFVDAQILFAYQLRVNYGFNYYDYFLNNAMKDTNFNYEIQSKFIYEAIQKTNFTQKELYSFIYETIPASSNNLSDENQITTLNILKHFPITEQDKYPLFVIMQILDKWNTEKPFNLDMQIEVKEYLKSLPTHLISEYRETIDNLTPLLSNNIYVKQKDYLTYSFEINLYNLFADMNLDTNQYKTSFLMTMNDFNKIIAHDNLLITKNSE